MTIALKEQYRIKRLRIINESTTAITRRVLSERNAHTIVLEALDKQKFAQASDVLKKLQGTDFGTMSYFRQATLKAINDVNNSLGGTASADALSGVFSKIVNAAKNKTSDAVRSPIPNALAFIAALENAFEHVEQLVTQNLPDNIVRGLKSKNISHDKVTSQTPRNLVGARSKSLENALAQSFAPSGFLAKLGLTWKKSYLDPQKAAETIMDAPFSMTLKAALSFKQGPQMSDISDSMGGNASSGSQQSGAAPTSMSQTADQSKAQSGTNQIVKTGNSPEQPDVDKLATRISGALDWDALSVKKTLAALKKLGFTISKS